MNKAIVFSIDNNYVFALAVALISLKNNSENIFNTSDFFIYYNNLTEKNQNLLKSICKNINFIDFSKNHEFPNEIYEHPHINKWGAFIYQKFYCFNLVERYDHVLWLDADILILSNIDQIFKYDVDIAWRKAYYTSNDIFNNELKLKEEFPTCNGGVLCFNKSIAKKISNNDILDAYRKVKNGVKGGIEERILAYLAFVKKLKIKLLSSEYNEWVTNSSIDKARIIHFVECASLSSSKPWKNPIVYTTFPEWGEYYKQWIKIGGTGPITDFNNFFNRKEILRTLKNNNVFSNILEKLDIIHNKNIYTDFVFKNNFIRFYIKNIQKEIHYEILIDGKNLKVCLHIENKYFITNESVKLFNEIKDCIMNKISGFIFMSDPFLKLEISVPEDVVNFTMNILVSQSIDKIRNFFAVN